MEKFHALQGQTQLSFYTHKKAVSDPACGIEPYKFGGAQKAGQTPHVGQVICVYTEGQKAGLTPHVGFDPAIGALCKHSNYELWIMMCELMLYVKSRRSYLAKGDAYVMHTCYFRVGSSLTHRDSACSIPSKGTHCFVHNKRHIYARLCVCACLFWYVCVCVCVCVCVRAFVIYAFELGHFRWK